MKKVVFGSSVFAAGAICAAIILGGSMANDWTVNGQLSAFSNIASYGLMPMLYCFAALAAVGLVVAVWGLFDGENSF